MLSSGLLLLVLMWLRCSAAEIGERGLGIRLLRWHGSRTLAAPTHTSAGCRAGEQGSANATAAIQKLEGKLHNFTMQSEP